MFSYSRESIRIHWKNNKNLCDFWFNKRDQGNVGYHTCELSKSKGGNICSYVSIPLDVVCLPIE